MGVVWGWCGGGVVVVVWDEVGVVRGWCGGGVAVRGILASWNLHNIQGLCMLLSKLELRVCSFTSQTHTSQPET